MPWLAPRALTSAILASAILCAPSGAAWADGGRFALVVANDAYPAVNAMIPSVGGDAHSLADALRRLGYDADLDENATQADLKAAVDRLMARVTPGSSVFLYLGGLGIQVQDHDYLLPVDAQVWSEDDARRAGTSLDAILDELRHHGATSRIVVVDAARHDPYERRFRAYSAGLSAIKPPDGTWVLFSAGPGKTSPVAIGAHSPLMDQLLPRLADRAATVATAFAATRDAVSRASNGKDVPWTVSASTADIDFTGRPSTPLGGATPTQPQVAAAGKPAGQAPIPRAQAADRARLLRLPGTDGGAERPLRHGCTGIAHVAPGAWRHDR